jgi:hypothetical protein
MEPALAQVDVAKKKAAELAVADAADEQGHDDGAVALARFALSGVREKTEELVVGKRPTRLVLYARRADMLKHAASTVPEDPALGEERRERAQRLPGRVRRLCGDGRAALLEIRVDGARFNIFDACGAAELCRDPAVIESAR